MIGQIVGNYKIEEKLGEGGMGAVYKGVDTMLDREVAIKALRPELASQTSIVERFRTEAVTLAKLNHPNIATLYSMFRQGDELYMVLEFVCGETLDSIMQKRGALPAEEAIPVFCQVLDGIDHAHGLGIVHRDIKPANMMLTENGTLKVLDFGIARLLGSTRMTRAGSIIGTLEYMAPEQVRGLETDGRSDIYALGMMLYEVLTGRLPFQTENEFELMKAQTEMMPTPPREINPAIPKTVEDAIMRAARKDPNERFQIAGDFRDMLLEAGLDSAAIMHGATGSFRRAMASKPPVSKPDAVSGEVIQPEAEEMLVSRQTPVPAPTRMATGQSQPSQTEFKTTRLAASPNPNAPVGASSNSFFDRLGVFHYVAAGLIILFLIGGVVALQFFFMAGGTPAANNEVKKSDTNRQNERPEVFTPDSSKRESVRASPEPTQAEVQQQPNDSTIEKRKDERPSGSQRPAPVTKKPASVGPPPKPASGCSPVERMQGKCN